MVMRVQKLRVPIRLSQPNLAPRDGCLLLFPNWDRGDRPETLMELLNSPRTVIPFIQADDSATFLLTRGNIDWVAVSDNVPAHLVHPPGRLVQHQQRVTLRFIDESRVEAVLEWGDEAGSARLSDYLNSSEPFVAARTGFGTLIVNKLRIRETHILAESAGAAADGDTRRPPSRAAS